MACKRKNIFLTQTETYNQLTWTAPSTGNPPASYAIYRDAELTELVAIVSAGECLQYNDHNEISLLRLYVLHRFGRRSRKHLSPCRCYHYKLLLLIIALPYDVLNSLYKTSSDYERNRDHYDSNA